MQIIEGPIVFFDVDDTLIQWRKPENAKDTDGIMIKCNGHEEQYFLNKHNLDFLIELSKRGHSIIVWSGSGLRWCYAVVSALGIENYVAAIMPKPTYYVDDISNTSQWMGKHRFIDFDGKIHHKYDSIVTEGNK